MTVLLRRIPISLLLILSRAFFLTVGMVAAQTTRPAQVSVPQQPLVTCYNDTCDGYLPHQTNCLNNGKYGLIAGGKQAVYDSYTHLLGYLELWFSYVQSQGGCNAYWGSFYVNSGESFHSASICTIRDSTDDPRSICGGISSCTSGCPGYHDNFILGYDDNEDNGHIHMDLWDNKSNKITTNTITWLFP